MLDLTQQLNWVKSGILNPQRLLDCLVNERCSQHPLIGSLGFVILFQYSAALRSLKISFMEG